MHSFLNLSSGKAFKALRLMFLLCMAITTGWLLYKTWCADQQLYGGSSNKFRQQGSLGGFSFPLRSMLFGSNGASKNKRDAKMEAIFRRRREIASRECRQHSGYQEEASANEEYFLESTFFDDQYKFLLCTIPKVASTNIKQMLVNLEPDIPPIRRFNQLKRNEIEARMNYTKIIVVRNPIDRLISAWRDKYSNGWPANNARLLNSIGRLIVEKYRNSGRASGVGNKDLEAMTLKEFFTFLSIEGSTEQYLIDSHWRPYVSLCDPCRVSYDYIVHFEDLEQELGYVMELKTGRNVIVNGDFPKPANRSFAASKHRSTPGASLQSAYGSKLPEKLVHNVTERYAADFEIFGYPKNLVPS